MSDKSAIEWTDATWNPVTGCTKVSPGCKHCYAERFAERWRGIPGHHFEQGFDLKLWPDRLTIPLRWTRPRRIFVNSMSDLFHEGIPDSFIWRVFKVMEKAEQHTFQVLTKRADRMKRFLKNARGGTWPLPNVWLGVSVENNEYAEARIPDLLATPAAIRWLSCEPLLGPVDLSRWLDQAHYEIVTSYRMSPLGLAPCEVQTWQSKIGWVVVGGESGPDARPMSAEWALSLRNQVKGAGIPFFFKQWGGRSAKAGGRLLSGESWSEYPQ